MHSKVTIDDDDTANLTTTAGTTLSVTEAMEVATISLKLSKPLSDVTTITVDLEDAASDAATGTGDNADYDGTDQTIEFAAGQTSKVLRIPIVKDNVYEWNNGEPEKFTVSFTSSNSKVSNVPSDITVSITDSNSAPVMTVLTTNVSVDEPTSGTGNAEIGFELSSAAAGDVY